MPGFNTFLSGYDASLPPYSGSIAVSIPRLIPLIIGSLQLRAYDIMYTPESAYGAIQGLREVQVSVITGITTLDAMYRLIDARLTGTLYRDLGDGVITPGILPVPSYEVSPDSVQGYLLTLTNLIPIVDNSLTGRIYSTPYNDERGVFGRLQEVIDALIADDTTTDEQIEVLQAILAAIGPLA